MAKIFLRQIKAGKMELADVPEPWREQVKALLEAERLETEDGQ